MIHARITVRTDHMRPNVSSGTQNSGKDKMMKQAVKATEPMTTPEAQTTEKTYTLSEAMLVMRYLEARGYLCTGCGVNWAKYTTQYHRHCTECKMDNVTYVENKKGSEFEKLLCQRLKGFSESYLGTGGKGS